MHPAEVARRIRLDLLEQATGVTVDREAGRAALLRRIATADGRPAHRRRRTERTWAAGLVAATLAAAACLTLVSLSRVPNHDAVPQQVSTPRSTDDRSGEEQSASLTGAAAAAELDEVVAQHIDVTSMWPRSGPPGALVRLTGTGCGGIARLAGGDVRVLAWTTAEGHGAGRHVGALPVAADGRWTGSLRIPANFVTGRWFLRVECDGPHQPAARSGPLRFDVTSR